MKRAGPPRLARGLLTLLVWREDRRFLLEDLDEEFDDLRATRGDRAARAWYRTQARRSILPLLGRRLRPRRARRRSPSPPPTIGRPAGRPHAEDAMGPFTRMLQDLRHAARAVRRSPRYGAAVIATFALASGANIAVFSVVDSVLLSPLPYPDSDELVVVNRVTDHGDESGVSYLDFRDWHEQTATLSAWAGYSGSALTYIGGSTAERWTGIESTPELFQVLGSPALHGRTLQQTDVVGDPVMVLSHALWTRTFGADPSIVGSPVRVEGRSFTVVGVMPPEFYFPTPEAEYWIPLEEAPFLEQRGAWFLQTVGRLAPGVRVDAAAAELQAIVSRVAEAVDGTAEGSVVRVESRHEAYVGDTRQLFLILMGAVGLVLAIACANIANLGLTRATARGREFAVRAAMGAGKGRLGRQLVAEHVLLALIGAAAGVLLAVVVVRGLVALGPEDLPRLGEVGLDLRALAFAIGIAVLSGVVFGSVPAWSTTRANLFPALKDAGRRSMGLGGRRTLGVLVSAQVALAVVLVLGAGLLVNSFLRLSAVRPGFDMDRVLAVRVDLPASRYETPEAVEGFYTALRARLGASPGVESVGFNTHLPFSGSNIQASWVVEGTGGEERQGLSFEIVGSGYFASAGIPFLAGRDIAESDDEGAPLVAVVNEHMARQAWPGEDPIGKRFTLDDSGEGAPWHEVVGVVAATLKQGLDEGPRPVAFFPRRQFSPTYGIISGRSGYVTVRTEGPPTSVVGTVREAVASIDPALPLPRLSTGGELVAATTAEPRFRAILLGAFAGIALLVALVGVYGVVAFAVARRTREIGIRMALGASSGAILGRVLRSGGTLIAAGLVVGLLAGTAANRAIASLLYGVSSWDPATYGAAAAVIVAAGLGACWLPARRASRVEPARALRED